MGISKSIPNLNKLSLTHIGIPKPAKTIEDDQGRKANISHKLGLCCVGVIIQDYPLSKAVLIYTPVANITTAGLVDSLYRKICKESQGNLPRCFSQLFLCDCGLSIWPWGRPKEYRLRNSAKGGSVYAVSKSSPSMPVDFLCVYSMDIHAFSHNPWLTAL